MINRRRADEKRYRQFRKTVLHQHTHLIKLRGRPKRLQIASKKPYILWVK